MKTVCLWAGSYHLKAGFLTRLSPESSPTFRLASLQFILPEERGGKNMELKDGSVFSYHLDSTILISCSASGTILTLSQFVFLLVNYINARNDFKKSKQHCMHCTYHCASTRRHPNLTPLPLLKSSPISIFISPSIKACSATP